MPYHRSFVLAALSSVLILACNGTSTMKRVEDPFAGGYPTYRDSASGLDVIFGTPDLGTGEQRIAFAVLSNSGLLRNPTLTVTVNGPGASESITATYRPFPAGTRGIYVAKASFPKAGSYTVDVAVPLDGKSVDLRFPIDVRTTPRSPAVGDRAPASRNRVASDVASLAELTTSTEPDAALYRTRIADALSAGRPFVVVFASPAFCTTPLCGPQVEDLAAIAKQYAGQADFIHIDLYENPHEIKGDLSRARRSPLLDDWGLTTDEWTFVVGSDGRVAARFEAYARRDEVEAALTSVLTR